MTDEQSVYRASSRLATDQDGLFASLPIKPGTAVFSVSRPLLSVLNSSELAKRCSNCFRLADVDGLDPVTLMSCTKCKTVKYCSKTCQAQGWKREHKAECIGVFAKLYPKILPTPVRLVIQLLLRHKHDLFTTDQWTSLLQLRSHREDFMKTDEEQRTDICLSNKAAHDYSRSSLSEVEALDFTCRVIINTVAIVTEAYDAIGAGLDPLFAAINHSCDPNSIVVFDGPRLEVRALRAIQKDEEITISYILISKVFYMRQLELQQRYFFDCRCERCRQADHTHEDHGIPALRNERTRQLESSMDKELTRAENASSPTEAIDIYVRNCRRLRKYLPTWPVDRSPWPEMRQGLVLEYLKMHRWTDALARSLEVYFDIHPRLYPNPWHPVRVGFNWSLLRQVMSIIHFIQKAPELVDKVLPYNFMWHIIVWGLVSELESNAGKSHRADSRFFRQVQGKKEQIRAEMESHSIQVETLLAPPVMRAEWSKLRRFAKDGSD